MLSRVTRFSSTADAEAFLNGFLNYERVLGTRPVSYDTKSFDLVRFRNLLRCLGDPHLAASAVHVAGTKGKGSTCAFLDSIFRAHGLRSGLYTSPHITHYRERIRADGVFIPEADFCAILGDLADLAANDPAARPGDSREAAAPGAGFRTVFEFLTAAAFRHFADRQCDIAVVETGLGGRLDATNVFDEPPRPAGAAHVAAITAIGLDHVAILGDTIAAIATEKAGILRSHGAVVLGPQNGDGRDEARETILSHALDIHAPAPLDAGRLLAARSVTLRDGPAGPAMSLTVGLTAADGDTPELPGSAVSPLRASLETGLALESPLVGLHQADNLRTVLGILLALEARGFAPRGTPMRFAPERVAAGVRHTAWPGRFERLSADPLIVVDGAHCPLSATRFAETVRSLYGNRPVILVAGFLRDKLVDDIAAALARGLTPVSVITCAPPGPRALAPEDAAAAFGPVASAPIRTVPDVREALSIASSFSKPGNTVVVVAGSLFLVGPARSVLSHKHEKGQT